MGKFEKDNVTIQKITLRERFQVTNIENKARVGFSFASPLPVVWLFDLVQPEYVEGHRFSPPSPLRDGWGRFWLLPFSRYWTGGHTERLEKSLLAFKQILIIFEVFSLKFVSRVCKYKFRIRPQRVLLEVLVQVEFFSAYTHATERWTWLVEVCCQSAQKLSLGFFFFSFYSPVHYKMFLLCFDLTFHSH